MECPTWNHRARCWQLFAARTTTSKQWAGWVARGLLITCCCLMLFAGCGGQSEAVAEAEEEAVAEAEVAEDSGHGWGSSPDASERESLPPGSNDSPLSDGTRPAEGGTGSQPPSYQSYSRSTPRKYSAKRSNQVVVPAQPQSPLGDQPSSAPSVAEWQAPSIEEPDPPSSSGKPGVPAQTEMASKGDSESLMEVVEVFYATDRLPTQEILPSMWRTFLPALALGCFGLAAFSGALAARRWRWIWVGTAGAAALASILALQLSIVRWQEYSRLASNASTRFSVLRFEPDLQEYPLHVGTAEVSLPPGHRPGGFERPSLLRLEFTESPERHIVLQRVEVDSNVDQWLGKVAERAKEAEAGEGFLFVHGYNVRFADALKRTAQLAADLKVQGPAISYSWPSRGQVAGYAADEATVSWAAPNFEKLILDLVQRGSVRQLNIVAHSMGNRALLESIERIYLRGQAAGNSSAGKKLLGSLILAAPDVDAKRFHARSIEAIQSVSENVVLYFSSHDRALQLSQGLHAAPRLGLGQMPASLQLEAIDTGHYGLFSIGHAYYGSDPVVLDDMRRVLNRQSAEERPYLQQARTEQGVVYWEINRERHARLQAQSQTR